MIKIGTLVLVMGCQRAGKTTFITRLGCSSRLRLKYLGYPFIATKWVMPKTDEKMLSETLLSSHAIQEWIDRFEYTPLLICHTVRWQQYSSNANLPQLQPLIELAHNVIVILIYPEYEEMKKRILALRPEAISTLADTEEVYLKDRKALKSCCVRNGWKFRCIVNSFKP